MVVPLHRVNVWADLGQFSSVLVNLLCPLHNPFRDTSVSDANQTNQPNKNAVNLLLTPWSPRIIQVSRAMMLIYAHVPHYKVMYNYRARLNTNFCMHYHRLSSIIISYHESWNYRRLSPTIMIVLTGLKGLLRAFGWGVIRISPYP